jgi:hypothetical protein
MRPVAYPLVRAAVRQKLRKQGYSFLEALRLADDATDDLIEAVARENSPGLVDEMVSAGPVIDRILEFLRSEEGRALIDLLIKILLGLI